MVKDADIAAIELLEALSELVSRNSGYITESDGDNHTVECDDFDIAFELSEADDILQIRKLDVRNNDMLGKAIIKKFHRFADTHNLGVTALLINDEESEFWENQGYIQSSTDSKEFFRAR